MVRGYYQLGSGLMTQSKILNGISNNIANSKTTGYKKQRVLSSSFETMMINRIGQGNAALGPMNMAIAADNNATIHSEGTLQYTDRNLDFAIVGEGFFAVNGPDGIRYTRKGNFNIDEEGYLSLPGAGRIMGKNGPIHVGTSEFQADEQGNIIVNGNKIDQIAVFGFLDYNSIEQAGDGFYTANGNANMIETNVQWKTLEGSNVDMAEEMTFAISAQRNMQSCSQMLKMYDQVLNRVVSDLGKV